MKVVLNEYQLIELADLQNLQEYTQDNIDFILEHVLEYENLFNGTNLQVVATSPESMDVTITAGNGVVGFKIAELATNDSQTIDAAGVVARYDIISCTVAEANDAAEERTFINPTTEVISTSDVVVSKAYRFTFHYTKDTETVPVGHVGLAKIYVDVGATEIYDTDITDIRPQKDIDSLETHRTAATLDHPNGCILDTHIATAADIGLEKIDGLSMDRLDRLIAMGLAINSHTVVTYNGDGLISALTQTGDWSINTTITYDADDNVETVEVEDAAYIVTITLTYVDGNVTEIDSVVAAK
jgi:hypothetical protein